MIEYSETVPYYISYSKTHRIRCVYYFSFICVFKLRTIYSSSFEVSHVIGFVDFTAEVRCAVSGGGLSGNVPRYCRALRGDTTECPSWLSSCCRATLATVPPRLATLALALKPIGFSFRESSVAEASANEFNSSSTLVILSRRFSFSTPCNVCRLSWYVRPTPS